MVIFHSFLYVYQRVFQSQPQRSSWSSLAWNLPSTLCQGLLQWLQSGEGTWEIQRKYAEIFYGCLARWKGSCERSNMLQLPTPKKWYINCSYIHDTAMLLTTSWHSAALKSDLWVVGVAGVSIIVWSEKSKEPRNEDPQQEGPLKYWRINLLVFIKPRSEGKDLMAINLLRLGIHFSSGHAGQLWRLATCQRILPGLPIQTRWSAVTFPAFEFEDFKRFPKSSLGYVAIWSNLFWDILWDGMSL